MGEGLFWGRVSGECLGASKELPTVVHVGDWIVGCERGTAHGVCLLEMVCKFAF